MKIRELRPADREAVLARWQEAKVKPSAFASAPDFCQLVRRNPELSLVAEEKDVVVGAILCSRTRTNTSVHQIAVASSHRDSDVARQIIDKAILKLLATGCHKTGISLSENVDERHFWESVSWGIAEETPVDAVGERSDTGEPADDTAAEPVAAD